MARNNLIVNPSFKTDTTGWSLTGSSTIARITTDAFYGSSCLEITKAAAVNSGAVISSRISVTAAASYAVAGYVKVPVGQETGTFQINVGWYTALTGGSLISTTSTTGLAVTSDDGWVRLASVMTAPALALGALVSVVQPLAGTVSKKFYADAFMFEAASYVGEYFDDITQATENKYVNLALTPLPQPHLTGMKLQADISLNGFIFNTVDEYGVVWVITDMSGWWQHPSPDMLDIKRGWGDGSYDVKGRWNARDITLEGVILCPNPELAAAARNRLVAATNLVYSGAWLKTDESPTKASWVRLSGEPKFESVSARGRIEFSIGLRAADPLKYEWNASGAEGYFNSEILPKSVTPSRTGLGTITNNGNFPVSTYITVTGPIVGPAIISNDTNQEFITITGSLRGAVTKTINNRGLTDGLVTIGTTAAHGLVAGDIVTISGLGSPYIGAQVVTSIIGAAATSTQFTYEATGTNTAYGAASGSLAYGPDTLEIDTYNRSVYLNGEYYGARTKLEVYNDWITLSPGANVISFYDEGTASASTAKINVEYRSGWLA